MSKSVSTIDRRIRTIAIVSSFVFFTATGVAQDLVKQNQQLMEVATRAGDVSRMKKLLATPYVEVNDLVIFSGPATCKVPYLVYALLYDQLEAAQFLIDQGADVTWVCHQNPVKSANWEGRTLLSFVTGSDSSSRQPKPLDLVLAALRIRLQPAELARFVNQTDGVGLTALTCFEDCHIGRKPSEDDLLHMVTALIEAGSDPNIRIGPYHFIDTVRGNYPNYTRVIQFLQQHGAN